MLETITLRCASYYLFESKSSSRSCYFESEDEVRLFKILWNRYMIEYVETHKIYLSSEGYQILLRTRDSKSLTAKYIKRCKRNGKEINTKFIEETWRIVSEQVRIFHSTYAKAVNAIRGREGVLVQKRYKRYYFESVEEYEKYEEKMKEGEEIKGQSSRRYSIEDEWIMLIQWGWIRGIWFVESLMDRAFRGYVVSKLIKSTLLTHSPPP